MIKSDKFKLPKNIPFAKVYKKEEKYDLLIELLNQCMEERELVNYRFAWVEDSDFFLLVDSSEWLWYETVLSKRFWFIEWLLKKDHVDLKKMFDDWYCVPIPRWFVKEEDKLSEFEMTVDDIVMYLSIQNNPVQSLISILK